VRSSVKATNHNPNHNLIRRTREIWQPRLGRDLSRSEAKQIASNVTGFFSILAEWWRAELPAPANDSAKSTTSDHEGGRRNC
jgi:hypothetical protein